MDSPPRWLVELHKKLWAKSHLFDQIFRVANLTTADFVELQLRLESNDSSRSHPSYKTQDVSSIKADFLREKSCGATLELPVDKDGNPKLVPSVSQVVPPSAPPVLDDAMDVEADAEADPAPQSPGYIIADANELSAGSTAIFPCAIRYMDLTTLELENSSIPVKPLTLIRDEWNLMIDLFNARKRGIRGSAIFTGSPGIGEHLLSSNSRSQLTDHRRQNLPFVLHPNPLHHQSPAGRVSRHGRGCLPYHRRGSIPNERRDGPRRSW